jgi:hypothetical protein
MLAPKIRTTDILGITSRGQLQLILTQATLDDLPFILPRYEGLDITFTLDTANTIPVSVVREPEVVSAGKSGIRIAKGILPSAIVALADSVVDTVSGIFTWKKK